MMEVMPGRRLVYGLSPLEVCFLFSYMGGKEVVWCHSRSVVGQKPTRGSQFSSFPSVGSRD